MRFFVSGVFLLFLLLGYTDASHSRAKRGHSWYRHSSGDHREEHRREGYQGHFRGYFNHQSYPGPSGGYDSSTSSTIHLSPGSSRIIKSGSVELPNQRQNTEIWNVQVPGATITAECSVCFSYRFCQSPSLTIGRKRFLKGNTSIGPITRTNTLQIVFSSQGIGCGFICTLEANRSGLTKWAEKYPTCAGSSQSPININTYKTLGIFPWRKLGVHNYNKNLRLVRVSNNGRSVALTTTEDELFVIGGNLPLNNRYILQEVVFHWGPNDTSGSEHVVDGQRYAGEIQLVHYNGKYRDYDAAVYEVDGLVILSVFLEISLRDNRELTPFVSALKKIREAGTSATLRSFSIGSFLPDNDNDFFRYYGSITRPGCQESVTWTIFDDPITISSSQLSEFRNLEDGNGDKITHNIRPVQDLNGRNVSHGQIRPSWSHNGPDGQNAWATQISKSCGGNKQSPINVVSLSTVTEETSWSPLVFKNFDRLPNNITLLNNDNGAVVTPVMDFEVTLEGGPFETPYKVFQYHFHWGSPNSNGSEHTINGRRYAGEIHMTVYNDTLGGLGPPSLGVEKGLYEVSVFLEVSPEDNPKLDKVIKGLRNIVPSTSITDLTPFPLGNLLPDNRQDFYYYDGSVSAPVPLCDQTAYILIFKEPIAISRAQMNQFFNIENAAGYKIRNNYRRLQPINGRTVYST